MSSRNVCQFFRSHIERKIKGHPNSAPHVVILDLQLSLCMLIEIRANNLQYLTLVGFRTGPHDAQHVSYASDNSMMCQNLLYFLSTRLRAIHWPTAEAPFTMKIE